jgi:DNA invertase Pin-like site-specific DNA recombinase
MTTAQDPRPLALAYVRVSTEEQVREGASLAAQEVALVLEAERRGFRVEVVRDEGVSAKNLRRPGLLAALERLDRGEAAVLLAHRLDRLSRSVADFAALLDRAQRKSWRLVVLDVDVDTATPSGEFLVSVMAAAAQFERRIIGQRTRDALAQRKAEGVRLGRPSSIPARVVARIVADRSAGTSLPKIADALTAESVPTAQGGVRWYPSTVAKVLKGQDAAAVAA